MLKFSQGEADSTAEVMLSMNKPNTITAALQMYSNTTDSSRKSSISENIGVSPVATNAKNNMVNIFFSQSRALINKVAVNETKRDVSFQLTNDDQDAKLFNHYVVPNNRTISTSASHTVLKSSSSSLTAHDFLKKYPKCFGAKFTGLPGKIRALI